MRVVLSMFVSIVFIGALAGCAKSALGPNTQMIDISNYRQTEGTAIVYMIRHHSWTQKAVMDTYYIDGQKVGTLADEGGGSRHLLAEVPAGVHVLNRISHDMFSSTPHESRQVLEVGKSYCYGVMKGFAYFQECASDEEYGQLIGFFRMKKKEQSLW